MPGSFAYPLSQPCVVHPIRSAGSIEALHLESTLQDLSLYRFAIELDCFGSELARIFEQHPFLPGAVFVEQGNFRGMVSRQRFLEFLIRPHGQDLILQEPLHVLHSYTRTSLLMLAGDTPILTAAQRALRRSREFQGEPIVVQVNQTHTLLDSHELNVAYWQLRGIETQVRYERTQAQMIQSDKMANLGRLVDGVAHEILDPISFIWGNLSHVTDYSKALLELIAGYKAHLPHPPAVLAELQEEIELDYLQQDLPRTIESIRTGAERLSKLASSLQNFCHIDEVYPKPMDIHESLDSILLLLKSRLTSEIQVVRDYGYLPPILCYPGQLNQVFMNILTHVVDSLLNQAVSQYLHVDMDHAVEALGAIADPKPTITLTTEVCPCTDQTPTRWVSIKIADNGPGLSPEAYQQLLESFSVKKRAEKETSLAVSYQIVTAKHGGRLQVRSHDGWDAVLEGSATRVIANSRPSLAARGTEFEILLPLA